jgi:hypothetical protein
MMHVVGTMGGNSISTQNFTWKSHAENLLTENARFYELCIYKDPHKLSNSQLLQEITCIM